MLSAPSRWADTSGTTPSPHTSACPQTWQNLRELWSDTQMYYVLQANDSIAICTIYTVLVLNY
jgi:hypothetical protein